MIQPGADAIDPHTRTTRARALNDESLYADNTFQGGQVIDPDNNDFRTNGVRDLNSKIAADERVDRVLVPIGDGMTLARRRS
jgi:predicted O-methyltransferase YrrM